jgi:hypothetical protein
MPQAVEVVGKAERQRLADLGDQAASGCARREFAFDVRENAFDLGVADTVFSERRGTSDANGGIRDTPAPMMLFAPKPCQRCTWLASESNSASASTIPMGAPRAATSRSPGRVRASHPGP